VAKLFAKWFVLLAAVTASVLIGWSSFAANPAVSEALGVRSLNPSAASSVETSVNTSVNTSTLVATAAGPPNLVRATLSGSPVHVLYVTRSSDQVLIRCYPGYEPTIAVRAMGGNPNASNVQQEGVMTCRQSAS
jgi:hypothetical protein